MTKTLAVIPARWKSKRFPGKAVVPLLGVPMIVRVWRRVNKASFIDGCILATDDERIAEVGYKNGIEVMMTPEECKTGTDRVAIVAGRYDADIYLNVQGDEPLLDPDDIDRLVNAHKGFMPSGIDITNGYVPEDSVSNISAGAVYLTKTLDNCVLALSRCRIPCFFKSEEPRNIHVGMYAFSKNAVLKFPLLQRGPIERTESIEMLRYLENGIRIGCTRLTSGSKMVDYPDDVAEVEKSLKAIENQIG